MGVLLSRPWSSMRRAFLLLMLVALGSACGGSDQGVDLGVVPDNSVHGRTSYAFAQSHYRWVDRHAFKLGNSFVHAFGYGDFDGDGLEDALVFSGEFLSETAMPARLTLDIDGANGDGTAVFVGQVPGGLHPRKLLVGDINGDGVDDAVLIDHGFDAQPFPGAPVVYVMSDGGGGITTTVDDSLTGFHHAGALGDFDNDGDLDFFLASSPWQQRPHMLLENDGAGGMTATKQLIGDHWNENIWTSEFFDLDGDGFLDLVIGGDSLLSDTKIMWGSSKGSYGGDVWTIDLAAYEVYDFDGEDIDGDGDRDLVITLADLAGNRTILRLYINEGNRTFSEQTTERFDDPEIIEFWTDFVYLQDEDNDGDLDILLDNWGNLRSWTNEAGRFVKQPAP